MAAVRRRDLLGRTGSHAATARRPRGVGVSVNYE